MLTHLQLQNLIIVDRAELDFGPGLTALTGETGAGKSIVVDALMLLAGGRGAADVVRQGAERAEVSASFAQLPAGALAWLEAQAIEPTDEVVVRRVIGADGRSRAYVNGQLVALQQLRDFAGFLIEIHGQQEHQHLVERSAQRELLDGQLEDPALKTALAEVFVRHRACRRDYDALRRAGEDREAQLELKRHQLTELQAHVSTPAAIEALFVEQKRISGRGRLDTAARAALTTVYDADGSAHDLLARAAAALRNAGETDPGLMQPTALLSEATILTQEAAEALRRFLDALDVDPARQDEVERHAAALESLARKHRLAVLELPAERDRIAQQIGLLENAEVSRLELERRLLALESEYRAAATRLTAARHRAAEIMGRRITELMQGLGLAGGRFVVSVQPEAGEFNSHGADQIEFLVSANPGQPPKALAKVASGGELSRISLAVQVAAASTAPPLCRVFDEVDSGIGGGTAEIVGRQLRRLGAADAPARSSGDGGGQVLCVTHLAQVASQAHTQFRVVKQTDGRSTRTAVTPLTADDRVDEIARMLGGIEITPQARAHAREMLAAAAAPDAGGQRAAAPGAAGVTAAVAAKAPVPAQKKSAKSARR